MNETNELEALRKENATLRAALGDALNAYEGLLNSDYATSSDPFPAKKDKVVTIGRRLLAQK